MASHKRHKENYRKLKTIGLTSEIAGSYKSTPSSRSKLSALVRKFSPVIKSPTQFARINYRSKKTGSLSALRTSNKIFIPARNAKNIRIVNHKPEYVTLRPEAGHNRYLKVKSYLLVRAGPDVIGRLEKYSENHPVPSNGSIYGQGTGYPFLVAHTDLTGSEGWEDLLSQLEEFLDRYSHSSFLDEFNIVTYERIGESESQKIDREYKNARWRIRPIKS